MASSRRWKVWNRPGKVDGSDASVMEAMHSLMEELWGLLRYLTDLRDVWPHLTPGQRAEIEESSAHREQFHRRRAEEKVEELRELARGIKSVVNWRLRGMIIDYLADWENQEPDQLKVLLRMIGGKRPAESKPG